MSVLYKHIIQVENKNVGLKVGGAQTYYCPPYQKSGGAHAPLAPPPLPTPVIYKPQASPTFHWRTLVVFGYILLPIPLQWISLVHVRVPDVKTTLSNGLTDWSVVK